jgi:hypothetical protein
MKAAWIAGGDAAKARRALSEKIGRQTRSLARQNTIPMGGDLAELAVAVAVHGAAVLPV